MSVASAPSTRRAARTAGPVAVLLSVMAVAVGCGTDTSGPGVAPAATTSTTVVAATTIVPEVATTTVTPGEARERFVVEVADSDAALGGLSEADLGCVADRLLLSLEPEAVVVLSALGPAPDQAALTVAALEACDLILTLAGTGMVEALAEDPEMPPVDMECLLEGVTSADLAPVLEALFGEPAGLELGDASITGLLADTPLMGNLMRCRLEAMIRADGGALPPFCFGLVDQVASIMTAVMDVEPGRGDLADMSVLADLLAMSDDIFAWLADEVPEEHRADAVLVGDATRRMAEIMVESLTGIDETSTSDDILSALFAASARMEAEMGADGAAVDAAVSRMELYILSTCGESTAGLFELLGGVTGPPAQA